MKIQILLLVAFLAVVYLYSCGEDELVNLITPKTELSGNIENWNQGGNLKLKAQLPVPVDGPGLFLVDTSSIAANGYFTLQLGTIPDSIYEQLDVPCDTLNCVCNTNINPSNARSSQALQLNIYNSFSDSTPVGFIYRSNDSTQPSDPGDFQTTYVRLAQNTSGTGNIICTYGFVTDTVLYNFSATSGWTSVVFLIISTTINSATYSVSTVEPSGAQWFATMFPGERVVRNPLSNKLMLRRK